MSTIRYKRTPRKNFLPAFVLTIICWAVFVSIVYFISPETKGAVPAFFIFLFLSILLTTSLLAGNTKIGVIVSFGVIVFMILALIGLGNALNLALILGVCISSIFYVSKER